MPRYTLIVRCSTEQIERFDHRSPNKLLNILARPSYYCAGKTGPFGEIEKHPDKFELFNSLMEKIHSGTIDETMSYVRTLK